MELTDREFERLVTFMHDNYGINLSAKRVLIQGRLGNMLKERGFKDGNILRVAHCFGKEAADAFREAVLAEFPNTCFKLEHTTALCSFYAEAGGLIIGFEGSFNTQNDNTKY